MDWFRWHHGCVNDPKFRVIARKAGATVAEALAMWATALEQASVAEDRGHPGNLDFEAIDCALDMQEGQAQRLHEQMIARGLIDADTGRIAAWDRRQPKRERDDDSAERVRAHRERQKQPCNATVTPVIAVTRGSNATVTPCNALEEIREEESKKPPLPPKGGEPSPEFVEFWSAYPKRVSKPQAIRAWRKLSPDAQTVRAILAGVNRDKRSDQWLRDDGRFIPNPSTYLNNARWQDGAPPADDRPWYVRAGFGSAAAATAAGHRETA